MVSSECVCDAELLVYSFPKKLEADVRLVAQGIPNQVYASGSCSYTLLDGEEIVNCISIPYLWDRKNKIASQSHCHTKTCSPCHTVQKQQRLYKGNPHTGTFERGTSRLGVSLYSKIIR